MSEYERLTNQKWSKDIDLTHELGYSYIYKRLYELENRIKAGTLVAVPYAIGQEVYWVDKKGYFDVEKVKVSLITIKHDGSVDIRLNHYRTGGNYSGCFKYKSSTICLCSSTTNANCTTCFSKCIKSNCSAVD